MRTNLEKIMNSEIEFQNIISELTNNSTVQEMKNYRQHYQTSCFEHCYIAAYYCYIICKKLNLDYISATRAAMLHDLFLYDWRKPNPNKIGLHAFTHGQIAYNNAKKLFKLNDIEKDMIVKHMWPVTIQLPSYIESYILTFVDKYCALSESSEALKIKLFAKKPIRFGYTFFSIINI